MHPCICMGYMLVILMLETNKQTKNHNILTMIKL